MNKSFFVLAVFLIPSIISADMFSVSKAISQAEAGNQDTIDVFITLINPTEEEISGTLTDGFPKFASIIGAEADEFSFAPVLGWNISIEPNETKAVKYTIVFESIPLPLNDKDYELGPAFFEDSEGNEYQSESISVFITGLPVGDCDFDGVCGEGENYGNCMQDCDSGGADSYCDAKYDLKCDPDCAEKDDVDCYGMNTAQELGGGYDDVSTLLVLGLAIGLAAILYLKYKRVI